MWSILELRRNDLHTGDASIDTMSVPQGGGGWGHLPNKGCAASAKSRPGKHHKISVQMMLLSIRIDKSM